MHQDLSCETLPSRQAAAALRPDWERLCAEAAADHPFMSWDWLDNWYAAFCRDEDARVIVVRDRASVRAIFPCLQETIRRKGLKLRAFSAAVNGHSPRFFVLARAGDLAAVTAALRHPFDAADGGRIDLLSLPAIHDGSDTARAALRLCRDGIRLQVENAYDSPAYDVSRGWEVYFASRSRNFRQRYRQAQNRAQREGTLSLDYVELPGDDATVSRLEALDRTTWQHAQGSGLFSDPSCRAFYSGLARGAPRDYRNVIGFLRLGNQDIAYELGCLYRDRAFMLKYGFDPRWAHLRGGVLVQALLSEHLAKAGCAEIDLVGEATEEKAKWTTHHRRHQTLWLLNARSLTGAAAVLGLKLLALAGGRARAAREKAQGK